jgi:hypothetical protein
MHDKLLRWGMDRQQRKATQWLEFACTHGTRNVSTSCWREVVPRHPTWIHSNIGIRRTAWIFGDVRFLVWAAQLRHTHSSYYGAGDGNLTPPLRVCFVRSMRKIPPFGPGNIFPVWVASRNLKMDDISSRSVQPHILELMAWISKARNQW